MRPAERGGVRQKIGRDGELRTLALRDGLAQAGCVPVDDDCSQQVERGHPKMLALSRPVADFSLSADPQSVLQRVVRLALVEADLDAALHVGVQDPFDHEQRPLDAADLAQGDGKVVLAGIGRQLAQDLARRDGPGRHGRRDPQNVGPVGRDQVLPDRAARQTAQVRRHGLRLEDVEAFGGQIADARDEPVAEHRGDGEDVIGEAPGIGILLPDPLADLVVQQPIQDVGRFADGGRNGLRREGRELVGDMRVGLQSRLASVFRVDQVHRLALPGCRKELSVAGGGCAHTPETGHRQGSLRFDDARERAGVGIAFHVPARNPHEFLETVGIAGLGHLAQTEVEPFGQEHVHQTDPVLRRRTGPEMRERLREAGRAVHLQHDVGDPRLRYAAVEIGQ